MAALIGYLNYGHHAGTIHRLAHQDINAVLATWQGDVSTHLNKNGDFYVYVNRQEIARGNVNKK